MNVVAPVAGSGWVAGLNHGSHDAASALFRYGELVAAVEQERLSRRKRSPDESPAGALRQCLDMVGIRLGDLDAVALGSDHDRLARWLGLQGEERRRVLPFDDEDRLFPRSVFGDAVTPPLIPVRHHIAHAASCFWPSGQRGAAVLVMDAMGEAESTTLSVADRHGVRIVESHPVEMSLGFFYEAACEYAGFGRNDAGKLMGLAPYGRPTQDVGLVADDKHGIRWTGVPDTSRRGRDLITWRHEQLVEHFARTCYPYRVAAGDHIMAYADFAASVQRALESAILYLVRRLRRYTDSPHLVIAGGVGLNCTANGVVSRAGLFDDVWVQPMAHDSGVAIGAGLAAIHASGGRIPDDWAMRHAYLGPGTSDAAVRAALHAFGLESDYLEQDELVARSARLVVNGKILAWHQGRAEVGPRALGARSLIGDPRDRGTHVRLNRIKRREMWRPVAPSVLSERFGDYFEGTPNPFMIVAARVRPHVRTLVPAIVHVDGSARPQSVDNDSNPAFAALLREVGRLTGIPMVVNTSLNLDDEPICSSPMDSVRTFMRSDADALAIGRHFVRKSGVT